jgi:hypothetical protein
MTACVCLSRFGSCILALWLSLFLFASTALSIPSSATTIAVFYAPQDAPLDRVVGLHYRAHRDLYVAVYGLTYPRAVEALVAATTRGIDVRVVTDRERLDDPKQRAAVNTFDWQAFPSG